MIAQVQGTAVSSFNATTILETTSMSRSLGKRVPEDWRGVGADACFGVVAYAFGKDFLQLRNLVRREWVRVIGRIDGFERAFQDIACMGRARGGTWIVVIRVELIAAAAARISGRLDDSLTIDRDAAVCCVGRPIADNFIMS